MDLMGNIKVYRIEFTDGPSFKKYLIGIHII